MTNPTDRICENCNRPGPTLKLEYVENGTIVQLCRQCAEVLLDRYQGEWRLPS